MKETTFYEIMENTDKTEGKGREIGTGIWFNLEKDALEFCSSSRYSKFAVMGYVSKDYAKYHYKKIYRTIYESLEEYDNYSKDEKIKNALNKLTDDEKKLLGLM